MDQSINNLPKEGSKNYSFLENLKQQDEELHRKLIWFLYHDAIHPITRTQWEILDILISITDSPYAAYPKPWTRQEIFDYLKTNGETMPYGQFAKQLNGLLDNGFLYARDYKEAGLSKKHAGPEYIYPQPKALKYFAQIKKTREDENEKRRETLKKIKSVPNTGEQGEQ